MYRSLYDSKIFLVAWECYLQQYFVPYIDLDLLYLPQSPSEYIANFIRVYYFPKVTNKCKFHIGQKYRYNKFRSISYFLCDIYF